MSTYNYINNVVDIPPCYNEERDDEINWKEDFFVAVVNVTCIVAQITILFAYFSFCKYFTRREERMQQDNMPRDVEPAGAHSSSSSDASTTSNDTISSIVHSFFSKSWRSAHGSQDSALGSLYSAETSGQQETHHNSVEAETDRSSVDSNRRPNISSVNKPSTSRSHSDTSYSDAESSHTPTFDQRPITHTDEMVCQSPTSESGSSTSSEDLGMRLLFENSDQSDGENYKRSAVLSVDLGTPESAYVQDPRACRRNFESADHQADDAVCQSSTSESDSTTSSEDLGTCRLFENADQWGASDSKGVTCESESTKTAEDHKTFHPSETDVHLDIGDN